MAADGRHKKVTNGRDEIISKEKVVFSSQSATSYIVNLALNVRNTRKMSASEFREKLPKGRLAELGHAFDNKMFVSTMGATILNEMIDTGKTVQEIIKERGLEQVSDANALEPIIQDVINNNPKIVADYKSGKDAAFKALIGQVMRQSKGKANPQMVKEILVKLLDNPKG